MSRVEYIRGQTFHGRKGDIENRFHYGVDYVLLNPDDAQGPALFSHNRANLTSVQDADHGGAPKIGQGVVWLRDGLRENQSRPDAWWRAGGVYDRRAWDRISVAEVLSEGWSE